MKQPSIFLSVLVAALIILVGYHKVFLGYHFFDHEDWIAISGHSAGNKFSNGWRADKGIGLSYFYGDPGLWHPWSLLSFWERVMPNRTLAWTLSVIGLDFGTVLAWLLFIFRFFPSINRWLAVLIVPLMVFCFDAPASHYARSWISLTGAIPLQFWVLFHYYKNPRWVHVLGASLVWWSVAFTGNLWSLTQLLMLGFVFFLIFVRHLRMSWKIALKRFLWLHAVGLIIVLFLGAWVFYSFGLDQMVMGYVRERTFVLGELKWLAQPKPLLNYLFGFIPFMAFPINHEFAAFRFLPYHHGVSVIFIFVFFHYLGQKNRDLWLSVMVGLLCVFFIHSVLDLGKLLPAYSSLYTFISNKTSKLISMYGSVYSLEVLLILFFVASVTPQNVVTPHRFWRRLQVWVALLTVGLYLSALVIALLGLLAGEHYRSIFEQWLPSLIPSTFSGYSRELLTEVLRYNAQRYQSYIGIPLILFFVTSLFISVLFIKEGWLRWAAGRPKLVIAAFLLVNAFLLSWSIYPLKNKALAWEKPGLKALSFQPTDRFYFVRSLGWEKTPEGFRKKYRDLEGGYRKAQVGLLEPPGLNISGFKSFTSKIESSFMVRIFRDAGFDYKRLYYGSAFVASPLLDMAAVNYYYSDGVIENLPPQIVPFAQDGQIYVYKNTSAWPYYYLADRLQKAQGELSNPIRGTAYLDGVEFFDLSRGSKAGDVRLKKFGYGDLVFEVDADGEEFLVVADAWHPFWRARTSTGRELKVYRTNEVFKGVRLEPGRYELDLFFDTKPYQPGIWISILAWMAWAWATWAAYKDRREMPWLN